MLLWNGLRETILVVRHECGDGNDCEGWKRVREEGEWAWEIFCSRGMCEGHIYQTAHVSTPHINKRIIRHLIWWRWWWYRCLTMKLLWEWWLVHVLHAVLSVVIVTHPCADDITDWRHLSPPTGSTTVCQLLKLSKIASTKRLAWQTLAAPPAVNCELTLIRILALLVGQALVPM